MGKFDYGGYFGEIEPLADALREEDRRVWRSAAGKNPERHEYVLSLGCNVLRTVNLAESVVAILEAMGVDFVVLGGPAACCGIVHHRNGDVEISHKLLGHTLGQFAAFRPKAVLIYCPSCHFHMDSVLPGRVAFDIPYLHVTEFLAANLDKLRFVNPVPRRVALHAHRDDEQRRRDAGATAKVLGAIAGLEVLEIPASEDWGRHCYPHQIDTVGRERFSGMVSGLFGKARKMDCDALVTVYHSCYREFCGLEWKYGLAVINYVNLVCEALGIRRYRDRYKALALAGDPRQALENLRPLAEQRGVNLNRLEKSLRSHFAPGTG